MKVMLINPPLYQVWRTKLIGPVIRSLYYNSPPLGIGYLAAALEEKGIPVNLIDAAVENIGIAEVIERIRKFRARVIGITATTTAFHDALNLGRALKEYDSELPVVIGGPHVTANPESTLSLECFDVGVLGEGEITLPILLQALENKGDLGKVAGIIYRRDSKLHTTAPREYIKDLDALPFPARHLLPMRLYLPQPNDERVLPKTSMITSRGCPYGCIFCDKSVFGKSYRTHSAEYIISEMEHLIAEYGIRDIAFVDSTFFPAPKKIEELLTILEKRKLRVSWTCSIRINVVNKELLRRMKEAGCWRVRLGIESGNDEVLRFINKGITKEQAQEAAHWANEVGLQAKAFFMIGHLIDNEETIKETIQFARSLPVKDVTVQINTPMVGTPQYEIYREYGRLVSLNPVDFSYWQPVFIPRELTREYLSKACRRFYRSFYLRPITVWRHLYRIRSLHAIKKYLRALKLLFFLFFSQEREVPGVKT